MTLHKSRSTNDGKRHVAEGLQQPFRSRVMSAALLVSCI
jgi:hypothetical protein